MRRVIDTSAWIEWLLSSPIGKQIRQKIPGTVEIVAPTVVQAELSKWLTREISGDAVDEMIAFTRECEVVALSTSIALSAADLAQKHRLATADAIIYATALAHDAELLTCDGHFKDMPAVGYFAKQGH